MSVSHRHGQLSRCIFRVGPKLKPHICSLIFLGCATIRPLYIRGKFFVSVSLADTIDFGHNFYTIYEAM